MPKVLIPQILRKHVDAREVAVSGKTVRELIENLEKKYPGVKQEVIGVGERINHHFLICVNEEDVRWLSGLDTPVAKDDHVEIVAAIAGG